MDSIKCLKRVQLLPLLGQIFGGIPNVFDQLLDLSVLGIDVRALVDPRQKCRLPILGLGDRVATGAHGDEPGEILIFGPESVRHPGSKTGANLTGFATVHQKEGGFVIRDVRMHGTHDAKVIGMFGRMSKNLTDRKTAFAIILELERGGKCGPRLSLGLQVAGGKFLTCVLLKLRFGVKGVDVGGATIHEQVDDPFGFHRKVGWLRREGIRVRDVV